MSRLAIDGGKPVRTNPWPPYISLDEREERAVVDVIRDGLISDFIGAKGDFFLGGKRVQELEDMWRAHTGCKYAVSMNSATSIIIAAMGAFGIGPGDEVIVTPYSHVISATAPLFYDAIPVFADSEPDMLCTSPESIERCISDRTKAMIIVDLFGQSAEIDAIMELARKRGIKVLSDSAHITKAHYKGRMAGTWADIGSYSFNAHKVIQSGEGGMAVTDDEDLAFKLQLLRNHAENCVADFEVADITNMVGFNFRMTELEAAVTIEQTKKIDALIDPRREMAAHLTARIKDLPGIITPIIRDGAEHDFLIYPILIDPDKAGITREEFLRRLDAEGISTTASGVWHVPPISKFVKPIHFQPVFTQKHFRPNGSPWKSAYYNRDIEYGPGLCPVVEDLWQTRQISINALYPPLTTSDMDDIADAMEKVLDTPK